MVEFLIVFPVLILLVLGTFQFALIYQAKVTLNYAAFEAARAGSTGHAQREPMVNAFARTMAAIHTHEAGLPDSFAVGGDPDYRGLLWARQRLRDQLDAGLVNITLVNPGAASFAEHGIDVGGDRLIPNDNLMYRDGRHDNKPLSRQSIQDANLLKIHVGYCFEMIVPFVNRVIWGIMALAPGDDSNRVNSNMVPDEARRGAPLPAPSSRPAWTAPPTSTATTGSSACPSTPSPSCACTRTPFRSPEESSPLFPAQPSGG